MLALLRRSVTFLVKYNLISKQRLVGWRQSLREIGGIDVALGTEAPTVRFHPASNWEYVRLSRILEKEPDTNAWIDSFQDDTVFLDVGANIGLYSIYTLLRHPNARVIALEPDSDNFASLVNNLQQLAPDRATAYAFAAASQTGLLRIKRSLPGVAGSNNNQVTDTTGSHVLGCFACSLDDLIERFGVTFPTEIKIDVDGIELDILAGARKTLNDNRLRSVLVESQDEAMARVFEQIFKDVGFTPCDKPLGRGNRIYRRFD